MPHVDPRVSVLLPVHNAERFVGAAVESILAQTFQDFELIVIDDGSTDESARVLRSIAQRDVRVSLTSRENQGLTPTLNEMLAAAKGEFVARMDADDLSVPDRLTLQVAHLDYDPTCVAVGSRAIFIDSEGLPVTPFIDCLSHEDITAALLSAKIGILHPTVMMRTSVVRSIGAYRYDYPHVEDLDLFLRLGEVGGLQNLTAPLLYYRLHDSSVSYRHQAEQALSAKAAVEEAYRRRGMSVSSVIEPMARPETRADHHRKWAWWALNAGNAMTACKHAAKSVQLHPGDRRNWWAFACAVKGRFERERPSQPH